MDNDYVFDAVCPRRELVGRVIRVETIGEGPSGRTSYEIDCIDSEAGPAELSPARARASLKFFAILRLLTTSRRLTEIIGEELQERDWVQLSIAPRDGRLRPIVFHSQLRENGYTEQSRGSLYAVDRIFSDKDLGPHPRSLGAAATSTMSAARAIAVAASFPVSAIATGAEVSTLLANALTLKHIVVHDVCQANFVTQMGNDNAPVARFDAGWPISFNGRAAPTSKLIPNDIVPIVLSHWDFDHLHGFHHFPFTRSSTWLAPVQALGPGQTLVTNQLADAKRLLGWSGGTLTIGAITLLDCNGSQISNDNGLAIMAVLSSGKRALLVGDANYNSVPTHQHQFDFLVVTHHGALFSGAVPRAAGSKAMSVISVGRGNVYKHPRDPAVEQHEMSGWIVSATAAIFSQNRGDRILGS